jgi:hypothetical protein
MSTATDIDLGDGHTLSFADWNPDLDLNPQYRDIADQFPARVTGIVRHQLPGVNPGTQGGYCEGAITFDTPGALQGPVLDCRVLGAADPLPVAALPLRRPRVHPRRPLGPGLSHA